MSVVSHFPSHAFLDAAVKEASFRYTFRLPSPLPCEGGGGGGGGAGDGGGYARPRKDVPPRATFC